MTITATAPAVASRPVVTPPMPSLGRHVPAPDQNTLAHWGFAVEMDGITAHEDAAAAVAAAATRRGIRPILVGILADRREPSVARQRAFGRLAFALTR